MQTVNSFGADRKKK